MKFSSCVYKVQLAITASVHRKCGGLRAFRAKVPTLRRGRELPPGWLQLRAGPTSTRVDTCRDGSQKEGRKIGHVSDIPTTRFQGFRNAGRQRILADGILVSRLPSHRSRDLFENSPYLSYSPHAQQNASG